MTKENTTGEIVLAIDMSAQAGDEYNGFSFFKDIEDIALRARNRAVVMCNMAEIHLDKKTKMITPAGSVMMLNYFARLPMDERKDTAVEFAKQMQQRNFATVKP